MVLCRLMSVMASLTLAFQMEPASMETRPGGDLEVTAYLEQHTILAIPATPDMFTVTVVRLGERRWSSQGHAPSTPQAIEVPEPMCVSRGRKAGQVQLIPRLSFVPASS